MKSVSVLMSLSLTFCYGISLPSDQERTGQNIYGSVKQENEDNADEFLISLLPLKILLEYQLRIEDEGEHVSLDRDFRIEEGNLTADNLKSFPATQTQENNANDFCRSINLMKNLSDMSNTLSNSESTKENLLSKEQLKKIYNSMKGCFFMKARNSKLWGPLWHCLNRLFLFFLFNYAV